MINKSLKNLGLVGLSIICAILLIEGGLYLGGTIYLFLQDRSNQINLKEKDSYKILCIGESTTAMGGISSYPSQLEDILNTKTESSPKFKVINKGLPATTTSMIVDQLPEWLDEYSPDMVVMMMGINDHNQSAKVERSPFEHWKTYKLYTWIVESLKARKVKEKKVKEIDSTEKMRNLLEGVYQKIAIANLLDNIIEKDLPMESLVLEKLSEFHYPDVGMIDLYSRIGTRLIEKKKYKELKSVLRYIIGRHDHNQWLHKNVYPLCGEAKARASIIKSMQGLIEERPRFDPYHSILAYCYERGGDLELAQEHFGRAEELRASVYDPTTKANYLKAIKMLDQHKIKIVIVQYPMRNVQRLKSMLAGSVNIRRIGFVDNEALFKEAVRKDSYEDYFVDRFAYDFGHCTPEGNALLARNIAKAILN